MPPESFEIAFLIRMPLVSDFLPDVTQQIHSLRASGVVLPHVASARGDDRSASLRSGGSRCTTPPAISLVMGSFYQTFDRDASGSRDKRATISHMPINRRDFILYARNFIFGAEDSLVSTVGLLSGVASAGLSRKDIIVSGLILICVEAFSMAMGSFLSESATEESPFDTEDRGHPVSIDALIMFVSYFLCGFIPLFPYAISASGAFWWSIFASLAALVILGVISAKILTINAAKNALRMLALGGLAIGFGVAIGSLVK